MKCELFGCMSTEETWTEEEISNFITNCEGKKLKAQFVEKVFSRDSFKVNNSDMIIIFYASPFRLNLYINLLQPICRSKNKAKELNVSIYLTQILFF